MAEPKQGADGRYFMNEGYLPDKGRLQHKFMLGRDRAKATVSAAIIESLWKHCVNICREMGEPLVWDDVGLTIAKAVAAGERTVYLDIDSGSDFADSAVGIMSGWQDVVPGVKLKLLNEAREAEGVHMRRKEAQKLIAAGRELMETGGSQTLHEAMRAYIIDMRANPRYQTPEGGLLDWGKVKIDQTEFCIAHMPDLRLCDLKMKAITQCLDIIAARPNKKTTKGKPTTTPISRTFAHAVIKEYRQFLRWLHTSDDWLWDRPRDYEVRPIRVKRDAGGGAVRVKTYSPDELKVLWAYATPWERALMAVALNTGSGMAEISSLKHDEVLLETPHPEASELNLTTSEADSWIRRHRGKTTVYAEWPLWAVTVQAVRWIAGHRPASNDPHVMLTKVGKPLKVLGQRNSQIANAWIRLITRVRKDHPKFRKLSFNKLRKTGGNWMRQNHGEVLADLYLSHGQPAQGDGVIAAYTNERWRDLHAAVRQMHQWLDPVFTNVTDPFPAKEKLGGANISRGKIDQIIALASAGNKPNVIAERLNISRETVRRWLNREKESKSQSSVESNK